MPHQQYQTIIDAAVHCAYECEHCAEVCMGEMPECARVCQDWLNSVGRSHPSSVVVPASFPRL